MARTFGDEAIMRRVLLSAGAALADYAHPTERAAVSEELVALSTAAGDRFQQMRAQSRLVPPPHHAAQGAPQPRGPVQRRERS